MLNELLNWAESANGQLIMLIVLIVCCIIIIVDAASLLKDMIDISYEREYLRGFKAGFNRGWDDGAEYVEKEYVIVHEPLAQIEWKNEDGSWTIKPVWSEENWEIEDGVETRKEVI